MSTDAQTLALEAAHYIKQEANIQRIDLGLILGSGWSGGAENLGKIIYSTDLASITGFTAPAVAGHSGKLLLVETSNNKIAAVFTGRTHYYEYRDAQKVTHSIRTIAGLGAKILVLTNGCGSLNPNWGPGTVVAIKDHINLTAATPLTGASFVDMTEAYSPRLLEIISQVDPQIPRGVYVQFPGPQYETPAEVKMAGILGGDLVGMSTTLETIAARQAGLEVAGLSLVTNQAAGLSGEPLDHFEVLAAGKDASSKLSELLKNFVEQL